MSELLILEEGQSYSACVCYVNGRWHLANYFNEDGTWRRDRSAGVIALTTAQIDRIHAHVYANDAPRYTEAEWREFQIQQERELMWQADETRTA